MTGRFLFIRDLQVAEDIGARARLGWFDKEFDVFGVSYLKAGEQYYLISSDADRIYDFQFEQLCQGVYCTPVETLVKKCPVPAGAEEEMARDIKVRLGKRMQKQYLPDFLQAFQAAFEDAANDSALPLLSPWQERIDGLFDAEKLALFETLVKFARSAKMLTAHSYEQLTDWISDVYADMGDDLIVKDVYRRDLYSLTYWESGRRHTIINAQKSRLSVKADELAERGILTTPIYGKTYWYNHDYRLTDARMDYEAHLQSDWLVQFLKTADEINALPSAVAAERYDLLGQQWLETYGEAVRRYLARYRLLWHRQAQEQ